MPETITTWTEGLTASATKNATSAATHIQRHLDRGAKEILLAAIGLEKVYRLYLKGDKAKLTAYAEDKLNGIGGSMAYVYIQAAMAHKAFAGSAIPKATADAMSIRALATIGRYAEPEKQAEGRKVIAAEVKAAKAEGRKALSMEGLQATVTVHKAKAATDAGETPSDPNEKRTGNIAAKLRDSLRDAFTKAGGGDEVARKMFVAGVRFGAVSGAMHGAVTALAVDRLDLEWQAEKVAALVLKNRAQVAGEKIADAFSVIAPEKKAKPEATVVTVKPKATPPKRSGRSPQHPKRSSTAQ